MTYIASDKIQEFVTRVENKKGFKRDSALIIRHLFEEIGECSAALWRYESLKTDANFSKSMAKIKVGSELADIIALSVYMADVLEIDLNKAIPQRFNEVAREYGVEGVKKENETH